MQAIITMSQKKDFLISVSFFAFSQLIDEKEIVSTLVSVLFVSNS